MVTLTAAHKSAIERVVTSERARFDLAIRMAMSRDDGIPPPSLWPLSGRPVPDGVVWPESEHEIVELVRIARAEGIPLVPCGGGTAASGGAVPADGGLVVDLSGLSGLAEPGIDTTDSPDEFVVDVRAGMRWKPLEKELASLGLATRLYPTSAPASTVGGWLAQGGAGLGSFAYGWFDENVESVRVVDGEGRVYTFGGSALDSVSAAEGTTGIITHVRLKVRSADPICPVLIAFPDASSLSEAMHLVTLRELPVWSVSFVNPNGVRLINAARYDRRSRPDVQKLPDDAFVAVFTSTASDREIAHLSLFQIARATEGRWLSPQLANREWKSRFRPLRMLRGIQSTAPADVVVQTAVLSDVLEDVIHRTPRGTIVEGTLVRGGETVVRAYVDPGAPDSGVGLGLRFALQVIDIAARHGGRAQTTGRYFGPQADAILGPARVKQLRDARAWLDPAGILNPGKVVFDNFALGALVQLAARMPLATR